ncbi:SCO7460 family lipoprotein [Streptomyces sp. NPDC058955]|uniref:SCO7460 family lipoprotein n=1 Tax=unclassified Streptomyces TaxID=2593676 RepID=UPI0036664FDA
MGWSRGGVGRRVAAAVALVVAGVGVAGCGTFSTRDDRQRAVEIAERVAPGQLEVVDTRSLFPQDGGAEVSFRIKDDADAVVRLRVDAEKDDCGGRSCDDRLTAALADARRGADGFRAMRREFRACGYEVHGLSADGTGPWISARLDAGTARTLVASVGVCLDRWSRVRGDTAPAHLAVKVAPPDVLDRLPDDAGQPSLMRLTAGKRLAALTRGTYHRVVFRAGPDGVDPDSGEVHLAQPFAERQRFAAAARAASERWLRTGGGSPEAVAGEYVGVWKLLPGRVDRVGGWVLFCDRPEGERPRCVGRHALSVTVGLDGALAAEPKVFRGVRDADGPLGLPTEQAGAPSYAWVRG